MTSRQDEIWNRACLERGGANPAEGDRALASLLQAHGLIMNGGVLHALEVLSQQERANAIAGYRYFGLLGAAEVLAQTYAASDEAEEASNAAYSLAIGNDEVLAHAFRVKLLSHPQVFAPLVRAHA